MKRLLVIMGLLVTFAFSHAPAFAQDSTAAPKDANKTEMAPGKKMEKTPGTKKSGKSTRKGKKLHKKNAEPKTEETPKQ